MNMSSSTNNWNLRQLFGFIDQNQDGLIDVNDIVTVCTLPNAPPMNQKTLLGLKQVANEERQKPIAFSEFASLLNQHAILTTSNTENKSEHLGKIIDIVVSHTLSSSSSSSTNNGGGPTPTTTLNKTTAAAAAAAAIFPPTAVVQSMEEYWINIFTSDTAKHLVAGGVAGAVSRTVVSPMERMKILFQVQGPNMPAYTGIWSTLRRMWKEEGFKGFMRGNGTNVIRMIPYSASQFAAYEQFKSYLLKPGKTELDTPSRLLAGALAGTVSVACTYPLDLVRTRLSIQSATAFSLGNSGTSLQTPKKLPGIVPTVQLIYKTEGGLRGLYRGLWPTTLGVAPYVALNFQCYEVLKDYLIPVDSVGNINKLFCGALAGSIAQTIIYPLDVLRRRFQVSGMNNMVEYKYNGTWHALKTMAQKEGFKSLYRGLLPNYLKVAPAMGVTFYSYELCKELMHAK